jgi:hypothetical protein
MDGESLVVERHTVGYEEAFRAELYAFREAVLSGRPADPGVDDAVGDARWIERLAHALRDSVSPAGTAR